jgi:hypothetical protein
MDRQQVVARQAGVTEGVPLALLHLGVPLPETRNQGDVLGGVDLQAQAGHVRLIGWNRPVVKAAFSWRSTSLTTSLNIFRLVKDPSPPGRGDLPNWPLPSATEATDGG